MELYYQRESLVPRLHSPAFSCYSTHDKKPWSLRTRLTREYVTLGNDVILPASAPSW